MTRHRLLAEVDLGRLERFLRPATVAFLALPLLLFAVTWLRPAVAAAAVAATVVVAASLVRPGPPGEGAETGGCVPLPALVAALAPAATLVLVSGAGGFTPRNWDWLKHDGILRDLVAQPWPVLYSTEAGTTGLVYYVAYLLPAAVAGKLAGWGAAHAVVLLTSLAGAVLAVSWLVVLARGAPLVCGAAFALFSGMDALAVVLLRGGAGLAEIRSDYFLENWSGLWQYSCTPSLLNFVPNQAVAGWLLAALLLDAVRRGRADVPFAALPVLGLLWSPFVALGMAPLALAGALAQRRPLAAMLRAQASRATLAAAALGAILLTYFAARLAPLDLPARFRQPGAAAAAGAFWLVPARVPLAQLAPRYLLFVACEFAVLWLLASRGLGDGRDDAALRRVLCAAGASLLALPLFHYGLYNDLVMRASIPALFVLLAAAVTALRRRRSRTITALLAAVLAVGAVYPANLMRWHVVGALSALPEFGLRPMGSVRGVFQIQLHDALGKNVEFVSQYLGGTRTPFYRFLARRSQAVTVAEDDPETRPPVGGAGQPAGGSAASTTSTQ